MLTLALLAAYAIHERFNDRSARMKYFKKHYKTKNPARTGH